MKKNISFSMQNISIDQFAIMGDKFPTDGRMQTELQIGVDKENKSVAIRLRITYFDTEKNAVLVIQVTCMFAIVDADWQKLIIEDNKVSIPHYLLAHFTMQAFGTIRGILYCKTVDTPMGAVIVPPTNVDEMVPEEFVM